jgi:hypothetical protein
MGAPASLPIAAAAALVLLALLAGGHCREAQLDAGGDLDAAGTENYNTSDAAVYWGPWQKARATWYGQPNGAGPDDNGEPPAFRDLFLPPLSTHFLVPPLVDLGNAAHISLSNLA